MSITCNLDIIKNNTCEIINEEKLRSLLSLKRPLRVKIGFDPTSSFLHFGHLLLLNKLRCLQKLGFRIVIIIGDFTAMIGDPSGKNKTRIQLTKKQIFDNYKTYKDQIFKILDNKMIDIYFNSNWFKFFILEDFIKLSSVITISRMLERNDFKDRYFTNEPISMQEFIYPLLQAYDSVYVKSDIELGGIDQKFNFLLAREVQKKFFLKSQVIIMMPILTGIDGIQKMSKSMNNYINIIDCPYDIFCKVMSIPDSLMKEYFVLFDVLDLNLNDLENNPFKSKLYLAIKLVSMIYSENDALNSKSSFINQFSKRSIPGDIDSSIIYINNDKIRVLNLLKDSGLVKSFTEGRRMVKSKSVKSNGNVIEDFNFYFNCGFTYVLQIGRKKYMKINIKKK